MPGIESGRLNKRVAIQAETRVPNGQGGYTTDWTHERYIWAEIIGLSGDEALAAGIERSVQQWRVTMRRRPISTKKRLLYDGRIFGIKSVLPDPRADDATLLICETVAGTALS